MNYIIKLRHCVRKEGRKEGEEKVYIIDLVTRLIGIIPYAGQIR
jgi:hypothetical protein